MHPAACRAALHSCCCRSTCTARFFLCRGWESAEGISSGRWHLLSSLHLDDPPISVARFPTRLLHSRLRFPPFRMSLKRLVDVGTVSQLLKKNIINKEGVRLLDCTYEHSLVAQKPDWRQFKKEYYGNFERLLGLPCPWVPSIDFVLPILCPVWKNVCQLST